MNANLKDAGVIFVSMLAIVLLAGGALSLKRNETYNHHFDTEADNDDQSEE